MAAVRGTSASQDGLSGERSPLLANDSTDDNPDVTNEEDSDQHDDDTPMAEEMSTSKLALTIGSAWLGVFLSALDSTIIATLSKPISSSFNSSNSLTWLVTGYLLANAGFQPISGKLTDIYGRRAGLIVANIFFGVGNLICGLAKDEYTMIAGRVVAGIGGGCLNTIGTFLTTDLVPLRRRGVWQGIGNICWGVGSGLGGVYGGWIAEVLDWRWAFLIQVPFCVVSGIVASIMVNIPVKDTGKSRLKRVDFAGAFTLVVALVLLLLGLNSGGNIVPWNHPLVYVSLPLSGVILAIFFYVEARFAEEPIIPVQLLLNRTVAAACLTNWLATQGYFTYVYYGPIYFQVEKGMSELQSGLRLIPNSVGLAIGSLGCGLVMKKTGKYYVLSMCTQAIFVVAMALLLPVFNVNSADWPAFVVFFLGGFGYGSMLTITLVALISAVAHKHQATITSASYAARSTGSTIGLSVAGTIFQNLLSVHLKENFRDVEDGGSIVKRLRENLDYIQQLPPKLEIKALTAYMDSLQGVWIFALCCAITCAIASLFMRQHTLYSNLARK